MDKLRVTQTKVFTRSLFSGSGGGIQVAFKGKVDIGTVVSEKWPYIFTTPKDFTLGTMAFAEDIREEYFVVHGKWPRDFPENELVYMSPFQWRADFWNRNDRKLLRDLSIYRPGEIPPPPEHDPSHPHFRVNDLNWLYNRTDYQPQPCPRCQVPTNFQHGAYHDHLEGLDWGAHTAVNFGAVIRIVEPDKEVSQV